MTFKIVTASQKSKLEDTLLYKSLAEKCIYSPGEILFYGDNKRSLTSVYNEAITKLKEENIKLAIFVHDDVYINCFDFKFRIRSLAEKYAVYGLAGTKAITIKEPVLWHLMSERQNLRGCVAHGKDSASYIYTSFGPLPDNVVMIDGVLIGVNLDALPENVRFDESIPSKFHFYDLIFSLDCSLNKVKVGVGDVPIIHNSPGLQKMSEEWLSGQKYFLKKYEKFKNKQLTI